MNGQNIILQILTAVLGIVTVHRVENAVLGSSLLKLLSSLLVLGLCVLAMRTPRCVVEDQGVKRFGHLGKVLFAVDVGDVFHGGIWSLGTRGGATSGRSGFWVVDEGEDGLGGEVRFEVHRSLALLVQFHCRVALNLLLVAISWKAWQQKLEASAGPFEWL